MIHQKKNLAHQAIPPSMRPQPTDTAVPAAQDDLPADEVDNDSTLYEHLRIQADKGQALLRVDKFLFLHLQDTSRNRIQKAAQAGFIRVNDRPVKSNYRVKPFDSVTVWLDHPPYETKIEPENIQYGINLSAVNLYGDRLLKARRFIIVACGTSWHAGLIGKQLFETFCQIPVQVEYASEFRYRNPVINDDDVVFAISQSGETADTLAAIELARSQGAFVFGIVNAVGSSIARNTDTGTYIHVGPEIGVASTKAFTGQLTVLTMLALTLGHKKGFLSDEDFSHYTEELSRIPSMIEQVLQQNDYIAEIARTFTYAHNFMYLGRGWNFPVALEGALKLKEISYIHAEGYPAAEMKHGPIALIDADMPVLFVATHHQQYQKIVSNMEEVKARGGRIIAVVTEGDEQVRAIADWVIEVPHTLNFLAPLLSVIPLQMLAYHVAVRKGLNVDMPRNLAKSVTVE